MKTMITVNEEDRQALKLLAVKNRTTIITMVNKLIKQYEQSNNKNSDSN